MKKIILSIIMAVAGSAMALADNPAELYMIGGATEGGWSWNDVTVMNPVEGETGVYSYTGALKASDFKIYPERDDNWSGKPAYHPETENCEISKTGVASDKIVLTNEQDYKWLVKDAGVYTITVNIDAMTISATYVGESEQPKTLYLIGDVCGWSIDNPTTCDLEGDNVFVYTGEFQAGSIFQAMREKGNWTADFIVPTEATPLETAIGSVTATVNIPEAGLENNACQSSSDHSKAWIVEKAGTYTLKFNLNDWTLNVTPTGSTGNVEIVTDANAPAEYYNLQGVRVYDPAGGLYLVRKGGKVSKVMIK